MILVVLLVASLVYQVIDLKGKVGEPITGGTTRVNPRIDQVTNTGSFAAAATTTPGGWSSEQNTGAPRVCGKTELNIDTQVEGSMVFSVSTSSVASAFSTDNPSLIASTTIPTGTTALLNNVDHAGTSGMDSWLWGTDEYVHVTFDGASVNASTSDYVNATGKLFVNCHAN